jgi:restriction endonuclease S subunit
LALLEGLEAVEIDFRKCISIIDFRIDANTYKKDYLKSDKYIRSKSFSTIEDISYSVQNFGAYSLCSYIKFNDNGIPFLMTENIRHNYIDWNIKRFIDNESHKMLYKSHCTKGQVLVTMAGEYLGRVAVYEKDFISSSNQAIAKISLKPEVNPYIISSFLNSKHGQNQIHRFKTITGQPNINMALIKSLIIPDFSDSFGKTIERLVKKSSFSRDLASDTYFKAETLLLETLGLKDFKPSREKVNIKNFKESFLTSGRLDAEYYQLKYEEIIDKIKKTKYAKLSELVSISKSIEPGSKAYSDEGLPFLRVADYNKFGMNKPDKNLGAEYCSENFDLIKTLKPKKDTILFSKDGSVGTALVINEDLDLITSGAILHLKVKDNKEVLPQYLALALNSIAVQMQAERDAGGSIILHWRPDEIKEVVVPIIDYLIQEQISELVQESFRLKSQSEHLLEVAKRAVEIAIEEGAKTAAEWIDKNTKA